MTGDALILADGYYRAVAQARAERVAVGHPLIDQYCRCLGRLYRNIDAQERRDSYWREVFRTLFRASENISAAPLPLSHPLVIDAPLLSSAHRIAHIAGLVVPDHASTIRELVGVLSEIAVLDSNPLLSALMASAQTDDRSGVLVRSRRFVDQVSDYLSGSEVFYAVDVLTAAALRSVPAYDSLYVIGPSSWYPAFVFSAPRAPSVTVFHYSSVRDVYQPEAVFIQSDGVHPPYVVSIHDDAPTSSSGAEDAMSSGELAEAASWLPPALAFATEVDADDVSARVFGLSGGLAVLLEAGTSVTVLDVVDGEGQVHRVRTDSVVTDQYLLLRTERGGDVIALVADHLLAERAPALRQLQREWKALLRAKLGLTSLLEVSTELLDRGSIRAEETNVRNWCSPRNIKTHDRRDFAAIMKLIGWEEREPEVWGRMEELDHAHRRAGFVIRQRLLEQVAGADLAHLDRTGRMEFDLPEVGGGSLTAFLVEECGSGVVSVPDSRLGHVFSQESHTWLE